jgi:hypothetical protein
MVKMEKGTAPLLVDGEPGQQRGRGGQFGEVRPPSASESGDAAPT